MIKIELTQQEAQNLVDLLDVATKAGGIQAAKIVVPLVDKIVAAVKETETED